MLELDMLDTQYDAFPYIVEPYQADQWDLTDDTMSRKYWLDTFLDSTEKTGQIARDSQPNHPDAGQRSEEFKRRFQTRLQELKTKPG